MRFGTFSSRSRRRSGDLRSEKPADHPETMRKRGRRTLTLVVVLHSKHSALPNDALDHQEQTEGAGGMPTKRQSRASELLEAPREH